MQRVDLAGDWRYLPYDGTAPMAAETVDDQGWPVMRLPSNWFLLGASEYPARATAEPPPLVAGGPADLAPVQTEGGLDYAGTVWFRRLVEWTGDGQRPTIVDLDMVDYYAEVFANGVSAGRHEGYFQRWSVDLRPHIRRGLNVIALKVSAPALPFDMAEQYPVSWPKRQDQVKGIFAYHDTRPGGTTRRGQERSTGGIIREIVLRESSGVDLVDLTVTPSDVSESSARLLLEATVRNWGDEPIPALVRGRIRPKNFPAETLLSVVLELTALPGESHARGEVRIDRPALWWPWDYGRPNLYLLDAQLLAEGNGEALDGRSISFGVRSVTRDDEWVWRLNGKRVYPRGSNYISTQWLSQADRAWYERDAELMREANLNSVRVHAHLERPEFYEVADERGLMVWQDFPLQWGYTDMPYFRREALRQAEDMLRRYRNHPSIVAWCMHNESPHAMWWMQKRDEEQNRALDDDLAGLVSRLDRSRVTHRDSGTGDGHLYHGWYWGAVQGYAQADRREVFVTEYGAQALPCVDTLRAMFGDDLLWPSEGSEWEPWIFANFQPEQTFQIARVERGERIEEFVANSQRYQATLVRFATEVLRRGKWTTSTGLYHFMLVDNWPSITWAVVDYFRRPKLGYAALRASMQPVLPSVEYQIDAPSAPLAIHVVNDLHERFEGAQLKWLIVGPDASRAIERRTLDIAPDSAEKIVDLGSLPSVTEGEGRLEVWLEDGAGHLLGQSSLSRDDFFPPA